MTTGRIIKRNKKWGYVISLPFDAEKGKYPQRWRSGFETKKAAQIAMNEDIASLDEGNKTTDKTVKEFGDTWLKSIQNKCKPRTLDTYSFELEKRIYPYLGSKKLDKVTPQDINKLYAHLQKTLSPSTVHRVHRTLRTLLNRAVKHGVINKSPLTYVDSPTSKIERRNPMSIDDITKVVAWLESRFPVTHLAVILAVYTGMRRGELCGLRWMDIDVQTSTLRVVQARQRIKGIDSIGQPKTNRSIRPIPVGAEVIEKLTSWKQELQNHVALRGEDWKEESLVLVRKDGVIIDPHSLVSDLRKAIHALSLPQSSFHDLRHAHATILLRSGVPLKVVSERLGHENIMQTANTYSHVTETMQREAVEKLSEAFHLTSEK